MYKATWIFGVIFFFVATAFRYRWLSLDQKKKLTIKRLFVIDSYVVGGESVLLICQLIGLSWLVLGIIFFNALSKPDVNAILNEIIWSAPVIVFSWLFVFLSKKK